MGELREAFNEFALSLTRGASKAMTSHVIEMLTSNRDSRMCPHMIEVSSRDEKER